jgi:hypothetical protein
VEMVKNILVKDFQTFKDHVVSTDEKVDPILCNSLSFLKGQIWRHLRTNLTPVFSSRKMKMMFYLVDTCGKELADCLHKATADGKIFQDKRSCKFHCKIKVWKLWKIQEYIYLYMCVCVCVCARARA